MRRLGIIVPALPGGPGAPEDRPFGRAALALEAEGVAVVVGHHAGDGVLHGLRARPGRWEPASVRPDAVYDRFPSAGQPEAHRALLAALPGVPVANPPSIDRLCRDKLETERLLLRHGVALPEVEHDPSRFAERLAGWGAGFLKPRYGALGRGVRRVVAGDPLPAEVEGARGPEPALLQRAVPPPDGWSGVAARVLVQRTLDGWTTDVPVARRSRTDPVVNAARGAGVASLAEAAPGSLAEAEAVSVAIARVLAALPHGDDLVEIGVDLVLDPAGRPWPVEVNGRPRGHLEALAAIDPERWMDAHVAACARPLRWLAAR